MRQIMPVAVILLVVSGGVRFAIRGDRRGSVGSRSGDGLLLNVGLAFGVSGVFVSAMWAVRSGKMGARGFQHAHLTRHTASPVMVAIVLPTQTMFYL